MTACEIKALAEKYKDEYEYVGVRTQEEPFSIGKMDHCSSVWCDGDETDETLDGICATNIYSDALKCHTGENVRSEYFGSHIAIICGHNAEGGEDDGEIIISDPVVVEVIA